MIRYQNIDFVTIAFHGSSKKLRSLAHRVKKILAANILMETFK